MRTKMIVWLSKIMLPIIFLSFHMSSYGVAAYIPQTLRECISAIYEGADSHRRKQSLEELYLSIRENRIITSDVIVYKAINEALEIIKLSDSNFNNYEIIKYLEQYRNSLNDRALLLAIDGDSSHAQAWSMGLIARCMREESMAFDLLRLSNELSGNLILAGAGTVALDSRVMAKLRVTSMGNPGIAFSPSDMTNTQSLTPPIIIGSTGVGSSVINGWPLTLSTNPQYPINIQFEVPGDFAKNKSVALEIGLLVPSNGLPSGYANFKIKSKYLAAGHSFNTQNIDWTHTDTSGNIKVNEASTAGNVKYMLIRIPLTKSHIKHGYFALLNISRILPTDSKTEYSGDLVIVSAVFRYTSQ